MTDEPSFREKYKWWRDCEYDGDGQPVPAERIERLYDEAHPKEVTAEDVWIETFKKHSPSGSVPPLDTMEPFVSMIDALCNENADLRNAARRRDEEGLAERVAKAAIGAWQLYRVGHEAGAVKRETIAAVRKVLEGEG